MMGNSVDAEDRALMRRWKGYRRGRPLHLPYYKGFPVLEEFMAKLMPREHLPHVTLTSFTDNCPKRYSDAQRRAQPANSPLDCFFPGLLLAATLLHQGLTCLASGPFSCPGLFLSLSLFLAPFKRLCG